MPRPADCQSASRSSAGLQVANRRYNSGGGEDVYVYKRWKPRNIRNVVEYQQL